MTRPAFDTVRTLVVKVGSALLQSGPDTFERIAADIAALRTRGVRVTLVSSGAVALGRPKLGLPAGSLTLEQKQAAAAAGQTLLVDAWSKAFAPHGIQTAQALITPDVTEIRRRWLNARATLTTLLDLKAVPVVNENDTVATDELRYGDNDRLAARVAQLVSADLLVLLSDVDGLYDRDPRLHADARKIDDIAEITPEIRAMGGKSNPLAGVGSGGMATKLAAAEIANTSGCATVIAHGEADWPLLSLEHPGHGSWLAAKPPQRGRTSWLAGALEPHGEIFIDDGAARALAAGKSLLPVGVTRIKGQFERGDPVFIRAGDGRALARGISGYDAEDARQIAGRRTDEIETLLGYRRAAALVHADDILITDADNA